MANPQYQVQRGTAAPAGEFSFGSDRIRKRIPKRIDALTAHRRPALS